MQTDLPARGCIVTFYSYKGGTGRTMALANVACLLAEAGEEVLVIDWDLEAPGLHRFFPPRLRTAPQGNDLGLDDTPGLINLFLALKQRLPAAPPASEDAAEVAVERAFAGVDLDAYVRDTGVPGVRIMRAGRDDDRGYSRRVGTFNWEMVFEHAPGIYREFAERLSTRYRWVLADSRTGVTDISGICTSLLPERLVVVFTPNRQSLTGVNALVQRATEYRRSSDDLRPLLVYPLPSRIEGSLEKQKARWRFGDPDQEIIGYQPMFEELLAASYGLGRCDLGAYFDDVQIQQTPDYAYGEEIAVRRPGDRLSMANSYVVFTNRLKTGEPPWAVTPAAMPAPEPAQAPVIPQAAPSPSTVVRPPVLERPRAPSPRPSPAAPPPSSPTRSRPSSVAAPHVASQVFLSYAATDRDLVASVASHLSSRGLQVWFERTVTAGSDYSSDVSQRLDASDAVVVFWSRASVDSRWVMAEAEEGLRRGILIPVLIDDVSPPLAFRSVQSADLRRPTADAIDRLAEDVRRVAAATPGTIVYPSAAPRSGRARLVAISAAAVVTMLAVGSWLYTRPGSTPGSQTQPSTGAQTLTMPNFVGTASADVAKTAGLIGLTVSMSDGRGATGPYLEGVVTSQNPAAGTTVARSSRVDVQIATRTVQVPTLVGTTLNSALPALEKNGLRLGKTTTQRVNDAKPGTILRQSPEAGASVPAGAAVDVVVAAAPVEAVTVPSVVGMRLEEAETTLKRAGLDPQADYERQADVDRPGNVVDQTPAAGTRVRRDSPVKLTVGSAPRSRP